MKYLVRVLPLACAAMLLSGCPDAKLPTPSPTVPTPKANVAVQPSGGQLLRAAAGLELDDQACCASPKWNTPGARIGFTST